MPYAYAKKLLPTWAYNNTKSRFNPHCMKFASKYHHCTSELIIILCTEQLGRNLWRWAIYSLLEFHPIQSYNTHAKAAYRQITFFMVISYVRFKDVWKSFVVRAKDSQSTVSRLNLSIPKLAQAPGMFTLRPFISETESSSIKHAFEWNWVNIMNKRNPITRRHCAVHFDVSVVKMTSPLTRR